MMKIVINQSGFPLKSHYCDDIQKNRFPAIKKFFFTKTQKRTSFCNWIEHLKSSMQKRYFHNFTFERSMTPPNGHFWSLINKTLCTGQVVMRNTSGQTFPILSYKHDAQSKIRKILGFKRLFLKMLWIKKLWNLGGPIFNLRLHLKIILAFHFSKIIALFLLSWIICKPT